MQNMNRRSFVGIAASAISALALQACGNQQQAQETPESASSTSADASSSAEPGHVTASGTLTTPYDEGYSSGAHHATIVVKDYGTIKVELDADTAPISVSNFAHLVNEGFYTGTTFHRIIKGFMIQGGAPKDPAAETNMVHVIGEFEANGKKNDIKHERGVISMARASQNNSGSSQFFIVHETSSHLDGQYAAFGHVTEGMDVVDKIAEVPVQDSNGTVAAGDQPVIESITMND